MYRKYIPLIFMLTTGAVTCIVSIVRGYTLFKQLLLLLTVLLIFYYIGSLLKWMLDYFDRQNERRAKEQGEVIEKNAETGAESSDTNREE